MIKQLSIFLENKKGRMWKALDVLEEDFHLQIHLILGF